MSWTRAPKIDPIRSRTVFLKPRQYRHSGQQLLDGLTHFWFLRAKYKWPGNRAICTALIKRIPLFRRLHPLAGGLDFRGAELEFGNLAERIERRIGQDVRRRFHIGEGNEHNAVRDPV